MKKILMIDYYGMCDQNGQAVGHSPKVLEEYTDLVENDFEVNAAVSPCLIQGVNPKVHKLYKLKYDISTENAQSILKRITDKIKLFHNIRQVLKLNAYDIYWFYKTDFFLFLFFCLSGKKRKHYTKKFIAQIYQESFGSGIIQKILDRIYRKGMLKFDGIIYTQKDMAATHPNTLHIPDYYYDAGKYKKYESTEKEEKVVCLGTMNPYKKLDELVDTFNRNGYPLEIRGYFFDKNFYRSLCNKINANIVIEDRILSEEEYYKTLARAKYTILPYDMEQYQSRTSGVLIESMFLNTIAIAPMQLLRANQIEGIGYETLAELADASFFCKEYKPDNRAKMKEYDKEEVGRRLREFMANN